MAGKFPIYSKDIMFDYQLRYVDGGIPTKWGTLSSLCFTNPLLAMSQANHLVRAIEYTSSDDAVRLPSVRPGTWCDRSEKLWILTRRNRKT